MKKKSTRPSASHFATFSHYIPYSFRCYCNIELAHY